MEVTEMLGRTAEGMSARRVFSEPIQQDGSTVVLAAAVRGGGGGGENRGAETQRGAGSGSGFGFVARPAGAFVVRNGKVSWRPAFDLNRAILGGQLVAASALLLARAVVRSRSRMAPRRRFSRR